jgi:uncharacterized protein (DUF1800 family)
VTRLRHLVVRRCGLAKRWVAVWGLCVFLTASAFAAPPSDAQVFHVLNRLAYGPTPADVERVRQLGIDGYIDEQLHPERISVLAALQHSLDALRSTHLSQRELMAQFRQARQARSAGEPNQTMLRDLYERETLESGEQRLLLAIDSPRQLQEVMVDFWFNYFNVYSGKGLDHVLVENYEREAIRPHVMGRFRDLPGATAHHPAMLFYLDNWLSSAAVQPSAAGAVARGKATGLNENYARELMELHTLGTDGGYTQRDVTELARMLTGWTLDLRGQGSGNSAFVFDARRHDNGDKDWLGRHVGGRGQAEGEWALDVLAAHPATAHHLAYELAQYFVADEPPPALVDRLAKRFADTDGNIGAVLKLLFDSAEFRDPAIRSGKFKTPYRYVVSSMRAARLPVANVRPLLATLHQLGMPLYGCQTPDGYKNTEQAWLNPDAITRRIGFATALASGKLPLARPTQTPDAPGAVPHLPRAQGRQAEHSGLRFDPEGTARPVEAEGLLAVLGDTISARTRAAIAQADPPLRAALVLGSPDFMRH